ncbi:DUF4114 domain-containing protein [Dolichospermum sp. UHCC 0684]|uniref:DUF4114 domain-containing protein n=1 Tax=unclassified Dolichospermum TaxID=2622029 RepID=UPI001446924A|nr:MULTISPECIES: DUF4114 domain-containing protein [unclassified Dolichospermum]MEA5529261.1 DUF4114 domain-containing protein [Dolichospermum sp. UHCC 0684]
MANLTPAEITNWYLYGIKSTPSNLVDDKLIRPATLPVPTSVKVDKNDFMKSVGRFAVGAQFELVKKFFDPGFFDPTIPTGTYTKQQLAAKFGISNFGWEMRHIDYQDDVDDYAERVYIWNSQSFQISDNAVFIVEPDGKKRIEKFSIEPRIVDYQENFDFVGGGIIAAIGNPYLQERVDPSNIGRTVNINFTGSLTGVLYDKTAFDNDLAKMSSWGSLNIFKLKPDMDTLLANLFTGGVTKFLDGNKPIMYGQPGNDLLISPAYLQYYPTLISYKDNGVVILGGTGSDNIFGAQYNDKLLGGKGEDWLRGNDGNDSLSGGAGNDTIDGGDGKDESRYQGARSDYDIEFLSDKSVKITDKLSDRDGSDTLTNIETAVFSDKSVDLRPGQDIAFVIDTTGSMFDDIDAVKASAGDIINSIFDSFLNSRIAVVGYNDPTTNTFLSFTDYPKIEDRKTAALQAINSISVGGGGDFPEVVNAGLIRALSGGAGEWRKEANARRIILFGDAPAKDTDLFDQVVQLAANLDVSVSARSLLASDVQTTNPTDGLSVTSFSVLSADATGSPIIVPVEIFSVLIGNDPSAAADFTKLANATGGKNFQAADASQVVSVLIDALKQSAQAPIAIADTTNTTSSTSVEINVLSNDSDPNDDSLTITKINNSDISLGDKVTLSSGAIVSLTDAGTLAYDPNGQFDLLAPEATDFDTFEYTVGDGNGNFDTATVTVDITGSLQRTLSLGKIADDIFTISGNTPKLQVNLAGRNSNLVNELGVFTVDDAQGKINGIAPGETGYTQAVLNKSKVIFSTIANVPNGFDINNLTSLIEFESGNNLRFLLVKNGTIDSVQNGITPTSDILFCDISRQKITDLGTDGFSLAWKDGSNNNTDFKDLVVNIKSTDDSLPLGTNLQGKQQGEVLDLRGITQDVKADFTVNREAAFNNFVGFYKVADENGGIDVDGNGTVDFRPGDSGYAQAAIKNRVTGIDLRVNNQGTGTFTDKTLTGGSIFAPFILTDGRTVDQVLNGQVDQAYFAYLGANSDKVDHIRLLGNNVFGFEDLAGGGDKDYNDIIVKVNLSVV